MLRLQSERGVMYGEQMGQGHEFEVNSPEEEAKALAEGCHELLRPAELPPGSPSGRNARPGFSRRRKSLP